MILFRYWKDQRTKRKSLGSIMYIITILIGEWMNGSMGTEL